MNKILSTAIMSAMTVLMAWTGWFVLLATGASCIPKSIFGILCWLLRL